MKSQYRILNMGSCEELTWKYLALEQFTPQVLERCAPADRLFNRRDDEEKLPWQTAHWSGARAPHPMPWYYKSVYASLREGAPLNAWDEKTFYGGGAQGYTDYPALV